MLPGTFSEKNTLAAQEIGRTKNSAPPFLQKRRVESLISPLKIEDVEENLVKFGSKLGKLANIVAKVLLVCFNIREQAASRFYMFFGRKIPNYHLVS